MDMDMNQANTWLGNRIESEDLRVFACDVCPMKDRLGEIAHSRLKPLSHFFFDNASGRKPPLPRYSAKENDKYANGNAEDPKWRRDEGTRERRVKDNMK